MSGIICTSVCATLAAHAFDVDPLEAETLEDVRPILTVSLGREVFAA